MNLFQSFNRNRSSSIFLTIFIPMILLVLLEIMLFAGSLLVSDVMGTLNQNQRDAVDKHLEVRKEYLETTFEEDMGDLRDLSFRINGHVRTFLSSEHTVLSEVDKNTPASGRLLAHILPSLIDTLRAKKASGIFVILNTQDLTQDKIFGKPCISLRDMDPEASPSPRNEDLLLERGPVSVVQSSNITTDSHWKPLHDLPSDLRAPEAEYLFLPFQTALAAKEIADPQDYGLWTLSPPLCEHEEEEARITYTVPLIYDDETVYGILGIYLTESSLRSLLPYQEMFAGETGHYVLSALDTAEYDPTTGTLPLTELAISSKESFVNGDAKGRLLLYPGERGSMECVDSGVTYYAKYMPMKLYGDNTPYPDRQWGLAAMVPKQNLYGFSRQVFFMLSIATLLMFFTGLVGSFLIGQNIADPVIALSKGVVNAQKHNRDMPDLERTGISEIDQLTGAITTLSRDIAAVRAMEQKRIEHERDYDLLTGLMNRRAFNRVADELFSSQKALGYAAMIMLDLDNLKDINDMYGHDWGDNYIYQAAHCFARSIPANALVARISGDEFYIFLHGYDTPEERAVPIEALRRAIPAANFDLPTGTTLSISASGGIALYPEDGEDMLTLMRYSDFAMYQVKAAGKNHIDFFDSDVFHRQTSAMQARADLDLLFKDYSLADYFFQPIFRTDGSVFAYESLLRVSLPMLQNPAQVLDLARKTGQLEKVEELTWVRSLECFAAGRQEKRLDPDAQLFLNSFANTAPPQQMQAQLSAQFSALMPDVVVEIIESENIDEAATEQKRAMPGFSGRFALDDYGSGYNSDIMLLNLRPKYIKIDISIIRDIDTSPDKQQLVTNTVQYAHARDMEVIAEGIETAAELSTILQLDVDYLQGYFLARPAKTPEAINPQVLPYLEA